MTKKNFGTSIILGLLLLLVAYIGISLLNKAPSTTQEETTEQTNQANTELEVIDVIINGNVIKAELARTETEKARGLMFREELDSDAGMLFVYQTEDERGFWMKDTYVPLDIIFINKERQVVSISSNTKPNQTDEIYYSDGKAMYVLELNAGKAEELEIKTGNAITF